MGDRSKSAVYSELPNVFEQHGGSLAGSGVSYRGLPQAAAQEFPALLSCHEVRPLGFDVWRIRLAETSGHREPTCHF